MVFRDIDNKKRIENRNIVSLIKLFITIIILFEIYKESIIVYLNKMNEQKNDDDDDDS